MTRGLQTIIHCNETSVTYYSYKQTTLLEDYFKRSLFIPAKICLTFTWRHPLPYDLMQAGRVLREVTLRACICGDQIIHTFFSAANQLMLNVPDLSRDFG